MVETNQLNSPDAEAGSAETANLEESVTSEDELESQQEGEEGSGEEDAAADKPKGVQKRIDELTRNWREAERDRDYWRQLALHSQQGNQAHQQQQPSPESPPETQQKPNADDYDSHEEYLEALADWKSDQKLRQIREQQQQQEQQRTQQQKQQEFQRRAQEFAKEAPDFQSVVNNPSLPITQAMAEVIYESEEGPRLAYHLGNNPDEASRIAQLSPTGAARELGKLESKLTAPAKPKTTKAPNPPEPVGGGGEKGSKDPEKMTMEEFIEWSNKQR